METGNNIADQSYLKTGDVAQSEMMQEKDSDVASPSLLRSYSCGKLWMESKADRSETQLLQKKKKTVSDTYASFEVLKKT